MTLTVTDDRGDSNTTSHSVTVNNPVNDALPSVSITTPAGGSTVSGTVTILVAAGDAEDAVGSLDVQVSIDGGASQAATYNGGTGYHFDAAKKISGTGYYEASWTTPASDDGVIHTIDATATDSASNVTPASQVSVTVDNVNASPTAGITAPTGGSTVSGTVTIQEIGRASGRERR